VASRPPGLRRRLLAAGSLLTGIGFTMSLYVAGIAYVPAIFNAAKLGILAGSLCSAASGVVMLAWLTSQRRSGSSDATATNPAEPRTKLSADPPRGSSRYSRQT
jgi:NhaA family Na+:H+ antiporter